MEIEIKDVVNDWKLYTLTNDLGMKVSFLDYGGIITEVIVPNKDGIMENVVLGYKDLQSYVRNRGSLGAIIGRVAGRIQDASFTIDEKTYSLEANNGVNHIHGGSTSFKQVVWKADTFQTDHSVGVTLTHTSPDGEGGYPGNMKATVTYTLNNDNQLILAYSGTPDKTTALTMTNHTYFNLSGNNGETVHNHHVTMDSKQFVELDQELIPTGKKLPVADTPFDFRHGRMLGDGLNGNARQNKLVGNGYDHYFIFDQQKQANIVMKEAVSGRVLTVETDQPGVVMYTGNSLVDGLDLTAGKTKPYLGVCFETQASPASLHHEGFPTVVVQAGETYEQRTMFSFRVE